VLYHHASMFLDDDRITAEKLLLHSWELYNDALETISDPDCSFFNGMGDTAEMISQTQITAGGIDQWFNLAIQKYQTAYSLDRTNGAVINNLALSIHNHAFLKTGETAKELLRQAISFYDEALNNDEEKYVVFYNEGDALTQLAHLSTNDRIAKVYFDLAIAKYQVSCSMNSKYHSSFNNWGWAWLEAANRSKTLDECNQLLDKALSCFKRALELRPGYHISISNCGNVFFERACRTNLEEHWNTALERYQEAIKQKPYFAKAQHYIGVLFMERARRLPPKPEFDEQRIGWFNFCVENCKKALQIKPCYPLCMFTYAQALTLLGDKASAQKMIDEYNNLTGSSTTDRKTVPLSLAVFDAFNSDLSFNFKSYPWKCRDPSRPDTTDADRNYIRTIYYSHNSQVKDDQKISLRL